MAPAFSAVALFAVAGWQPIGGMVVQSDDALQVESDQEQPWFDEYRGPFGEPHYEGRPYSGGLYEGEMQDYGENYFGERDPDYSHHSEDHGFHDDHDAHDYGHDDHFDGHHDGFDGDHFDDHDVHDDGHFEDHHDDHEVHDVHHDDFHDADDHDHHDHHHVHHDDFHHADDHDHHDHHHHWNDWDTDTSLPLPEDIVSPPSKSDYHAPPVPEKEGNEENDGAHIKHSHPHEDPSSPLIEYHSQKKSIDCDDDPEGPPAPTDEELDAQVKKDKAGDAAAAPAKKSKKTKPKAAAPSKSKLETEGGTKEVKDESDATGTQDAVDSTEPGASLAGKPKETKPEGRKAPAGDKVPKTYTPVHQEGDNHMLPADHESKHHGNDN